MIQRSRWTPLCLLAAALALSASGAGCTHLPRAENPRPPLPLDPAHLAELRPRHAAWGLELTLIHRARNFERYGFRFQTYSDLRGDYKTVTGDYYRTRVVASGERPPLVVVSPILGGHSGDYLATRFISWQACESGLSTFFLHQEHVILRPERDALGLESRFRESIRDNIKALDLFERLPEVDSGRLGSIGVSLGALKGVILVASDERLRANVLVLVGGNVPDILRHSEERLVKRYLDERTMREGISREEIAREFEEWLVSDPLRLAPSVAAERTMLILGRRDRHVPYENGLMLRRELGEPEAFILPWGHYTSLLAAPWSASVAMRWLGKRLGS